MFEKLKSNLNFLLSEKKMTTKDLSLATKIPVSTINKFRSGEKSNPTVASLFPIARYFKLTLNQLLGSEFKSDEITTIKTMNKFPLYFWEDVSQLIKVHSNSISPREFSYTALDTGPLDFGLELNTTEVGFLPKGTILLISPSITPKNDDLVIVCKPDSGSATIRRLLIDFDTYYLKPLQQELQIAELKKPYEIAGVVIQATINFIKLDNRK